jgi:hypothetical protein
VNLTLVAAAVLGGAALVAACYYVPIPKSLGRRIDSNGLIHSVKAEYLKPGTDGGQRLQRWPCGLVFSRPSRLSVCPSLAALVGAKVGSEQR